ncbi:MAG: GcrA family cell cycle regulator [Pseudomonadota bacterium]
MAWTDDRVEMLKKLWAEGLSAAQIANKIGGVTRNAVIGKVHRLGLSGRATPAKPQRGCAPKTASLTEVQQDRKEEKIDVKPVIPEPEFATPALLASGDTANVSTIQKNMCKWPIGDPARDDFHFCGQSTLSGKSYCAYHARLAFQPPQRREPRRETKRAIAAPERRRAAG